MKVGKGLHMLISACGVEGVPQGKCDPAAERKARRWGGKHCSAHSRPPLVSFLLSRHKLLIFSAKAG